MIPGLQGTFPGFQGAIPGFQKNARNLNMAVRIRALKIIFAQSLTRD